MKKSVFLLGASLAGLLLSGVPAWAQKGKVSPKKIYHKGWIDFNKNGKKDIFEDPTQLIDRRIEDLLSQMTMEEKTSQMVTLYGYGRVLKDPLPTEGWKERVWKDGLANIDEHLNGLVKTPYSFPYSSHVEALNKVQHFFVEETRLGIPVEFTNEGIRGLNHDRATSFPAQIGLGSTWNKDLIYQVGKVTGTEARLLGYQNVYAPIMDVARDQRWGRIVECYGEDPFLVGELGVQMIHGLQDQGITSTLKHFAVYSAPKGGRDGEARTDPHISEREMHQVYLYPFRRGFEDGGALGVMSSYNDYNGIPVSGNPYFLTELLRKKFGFKGYVVSDSDAVIQIFSKHGVAKDYKEAVRQAVMAGLNVRTTFNAPENFVTPLRELVKEGSIPMSVIDERVRNVLYVKFREGLFNQPYKDSKEADKVVACAEHQKIAKKASQETLVLLKNENDFLPLDREQLKRILVCGPNAKAERHSISRYGPRNIDVISVLEGLQEAGKDNFEVAFAQGCDYHSKEWPLTEIFDQQLTSEEEVQIKEAVEKAQQSDVIIACVGEDEPMVGENHSTTTLELPLLQQKFLKALKETGKPMVVVLINGRPLSINWVNRHADAIIEAWFPGQYGGEAIAEALLGDYNPGGRLSATFPKTVGQVPYNFPFKPNSQAGPHEAGPNGKGRARVLGALYPFGYGLSYTSFDYSDLKVGSSNGGINGTVDVSVKITNSGDRDGDEVVQLYVQDPLSSVIVYDYQLRGFERVHIKKGESKVVRFTLKPEHLTLLNRHMEEVVEPGEFRVFIGSSSTDIRLKKSFQLTQKF